jgi:hypothetical protein
MGKFVEDTSIDKSNRKLNLNNSKDTNIITMSKKQKLGLTRNTIDKFYTNISVAENCIKELKKHITISEEDLVIEPSAGDGAFINLIEALCPSSVFYDLIPGNDKVIKQDYFELDHTEIPNYDSYEKTHIIGNPPFGRQSSLAIKFIKKSCKYCDTLSFILPKSFKKDSMKKHFPLEYHLAHEYDLPDNSFLVDGKEHDVPCVFQIWEKRDMNREVPEKLIPKNYRFVKKDENPDLSFRRVGVNAGNVNKEIESKSFQSHYFIKFDNGLTDELYQQLSNINYECKNNTVGPKSISKQELMKEFNCIM